MALKSNDLGILIRRAENTEIHTENGNEKMEAKIAVMGLQIQKIQIINGNHQKIGERSGTCFSSVYRRNHFC